MTYQPINSHRFEEIQFPSCVELGMGTSLLLELHLCALTQTLINSLRLSNNKVIYRDVFGKAGQNI